MKIQFWSLFLAFAAAPSSTQASQPLRDCPECPQMVVVPSGSFMMGSPTTEKLRDANEGPQHLVTIQRPFAVGKYEVTFAEWDACVAGGGCDGIKPKDRGWGRGSLPVISVTWKQAQTYVAWLSNRTGKRYRLLSEAEWEYAARAGTTTPFHFGDSISTMQGNFNGQHFAPGEPYAYGAGPSVYLQRTVAVGSYPANQFGLHDMHGNASEWTEDCWNPGYVIMGLGSAPADGSAWTESTSLGSRTGKCHHGLRTVRGGNYASSPRDLRSASRIGIASDRYSGFRVARD